jgi:DivIVA domain-containing protein
VELDRRYITRKDFPAARRGYDPDEVDTHLRDVADSIEDLRRQAERPPDTSVAGAAAEQVRTIVEAAERSAGEIEQRAEQDARRVRDMAEGDARDARQRADSEAAEHIRRVEEATRGMLERADAAQTQIAQLLDTIRASAEGMVADIDSGAEQLSRELAEIRRGLGDASTARPEASGIVPSPDEAPPAAEPMPEAEPAYAEPEYQAPEPEPEPEPYVAPEPEWVAPPEPEEESLKIQGDELQPTEEFQTSGEEIPPAPDREPFVPDAEPDAAPEPEPAAAGGGSGAGSEGARLIALNMALNGTPREETAAYLAENFNLPDQDALLDEVYSRAG